MIKNIITLKRIKLYAILIFILFFLYSCHEKYHKHDISEIINTTLKELLIERNSKISIEFAPRLERNISDKQFLENNFLPISSTDNNQNTLSKEDISFMLKNKSNLVKEKISDYINCSNNCIYTNSYFKEGERIKNFDSFIRITFPYISINNDFAIIGYGSYNKFHFGKGYLLLRKENNVWKVFKKINKF